MASKEAGNTVEMVRRLNVIQNLTLVFGGLWATYDGSRATEVL